ncbi:MAG: sel1 repeat family protein [Spirochaetales bacterium]|nr:sel1 repeat family protein [Spirochaetales bacterium]
MENIEELIEKAKQGDADAQCRLGVLYNNGESVKQDYDKAFEWHEKTAKQEYAPAQYNSDSCM